MRRSALAPLALLSLGLLLFSPGCGTDVGNSGKPIANEDTSDLALVAAMQHDEVISSVNDGSDSDDALALLADVACTPNGDGSVAVKTHKVLALESEFGRAAKRKIQKDSLDTTLDMTYAVPANLGTLSCSNGTRPTISWAQLAELKTTADLTKSRKRSVTLKSDGSVLSESELTVTSKRSVQYAKVAASLTSLTVKRTSSFSSTLSLVKANQVGTLTRTVATLDAEPIVLQKTRTRGEGVTQVEILSGAVASTNTDSKKVVLRYKNLVLSLGSSCHPTSGSIEGQVFSSSTATEAENSFSVVFDSEGATLVKDDGTEEDMELEGCQF